MPLLAMDTATQALVVGVITQPSAELTVDNFIVTAASSMWVARGHSRLLHPALADVMRSSGIEPGALEGVVVGVGPGSYTGVRIAVSTAKALAVALQIPLTTVSTLEAIALASVPRYTSYATYVMPLLYARRQRAFGGLYRRLEGGWETVVESGVRMVADWVQEAKRQQDRSAPTHGQSAIVVTHDFEPRYGVIECLQAAHIGAISPLAEISGRMPAAMFSLAIDGRGFHYEGENIHSVAPDYALRVEAEVKLLQKDGKSYDIVQ